LNEGEERDQPNDQVDLRQEVVEIDLRNREEIESALKYLKNYKVAGTDSIAWVNAREEVNQLAWTSETLLRVLGPVYKKGDKLDCTNY
jgi:hypothetical protein